MPYSQALKLMHLACTHSGTRRNSLKHCKYGNKIGSQINVSEPSTTGLSCKRSLSGEENREHGRNPRDLTSSNRAASCVLQRFHSIPP